MGLLGWMTLCDLALSNLATLNRATQAPSLIAKADDPISERRSRPDSRYCQPGMPRISGRWWAIPLWQSMQVFSPVNRKRWCATEARGDCLVMSMDSALWQLRHSSESLALKRAHSCSASSSRWSTNFSRVLMVPNKCPQTSFDACILRAILSVQLCGTWQSGQLARTPERLLKWIVGFSSANTLSRIS